jgi:hypothetical protein
MKHQSQNELLNPRAAATGWVRCAGLVLLLASLGLTQARAQGEIQFSAADYTVAENAGSITITIQRTSSQGQESIDYTISDGTAVYGVDYYCNNVSGTWTFLDGESEAFLYIDILNNTIPDGDRTVLLSLSNPSGGYTLGTPSEATLTIIDDEPPPIVGGRPAGTFQFTSNTRSWTARRSTGWIMIIRSTTRTTTAPWCSKISR